MVDEIAKIKSDLNDLNMKCQLARDNEVRFALQRGRLEAERTQLLVKMIEAMAPATVPAAASLGSLPGRRHIVTRDGAGRLGMRLLTPRCGRRRPSRCRPSRKRRSSRRRHGKARRSGCEHAQHHRDDPRGARVWKLDAANRRRGRHSRAMVAGSGDCEREPSGMAHGERRGVGEGRRRLPSSGRSR